MIDSLSLRVVVKGLFVECLVQVVLLLPLITLGLLEVLLDLLVGLFDFLSKNLFDFDLFVFLLFNWCLLINLLLLEI